MIQRFRLFPTLIAGALGVLSPRLALASDDATLPGDACLSQGSSCSQDVDCCHLLVSLSCVGGTCQPPEDGGGGTAEAGDAGTVEAGGEAGDVGTVEAEGDAGEAGTEDRGNAPSKGGSSPGGCSASAAGGAGASGLGLAAIVGLVAGARLRRKTRPR